MVKFSELDMLVSGIITKNGEKKACVSFNYKNDPSVYADGFIPDCKITSQKGFDSDEIKALEDYLSENLEALKKTAAEINPIRAIMNDR